MTEQEMAMDMLGELVAERGLEWVNTHPDWGPPRQSLAKRALVAYASRLVREERD